MREPVDAFHDRVGVSKREERTQLLAMPGNQQFFNPNQQQTPRALGAFHKAEIETWWPIIKAANIKPE